MAFTVRLAPVSPEPITNAKVGSMDAKPENVKGFMFVAEKRKDWSFAISAIFILAAGLKNSPISGRNTDRIYCKIRNGFKHLEKMPL